MKVLINMALLKAGGGQNVGLSFLREVLNEGFARADFVFAVPEGSRIERELDTAGHFEYFSVPMSPLKRMRFEIFNGKRLWKQFRWDIVYNYFGVSLYPFEQKHVSGVADSNLFFPEVDFWQDYTFLQRLLKSAIDRYRIWGLKRANGLIFENPDLQRKSELLFNTKESIYIPPAINTDFSKVEFDLPVGCVATTKVGLFLCGWQKNKNYEQIPLLVQELRGKGIDYQVLITAPDDESSESMTFKATLEELSVSKFIHIIGRVEKEKLASLYRKVHTVFLLSRLESFSNNIIEAWYYETPLVVSDYSWSRAICKNAAIYVDRNSFEDVAKGALLSINEAEMYDVLKAGRQELTFFPSISEKVIMEIKYIRAVFEKKLS